MPETSADLLRRAATKIRDTASAATPGPWVPNEGSERTVVFPGRRTSRENLHPATVIYDGHDGGLGNDYDADHIALWHPGVATLVADLLAADASGLEGAEGAVSAAFAPELALARAILGDTA